MLHGGDQTVFEERRAAKRKAGSQAQVYRVRAVAPSPSGAGPAETGQSRPARLSSLWRGLVATLAGAAVVLEPVAATGAATGRPSRATSFAATTGKVSAECGPRAGRGAVVVEYRGVTCAQAITLARTFFPPVVKSPHGGFRCVAKSGLPDRGRTAAVHQRAGPGRHRLRLAAVGGESSRPGLALTGATDAKWRRAEERRRSRVYLSHGLRATAGAEAPTAVSMTASWIWS